MRFDAPPPDAVERGLAFRKLGTTKSVLMIGAHPDDENTAVLAELALGQGADVAYLSLTRGEGGQNGIGGEQQEALGLLRTEELLAARDVDRGRQYFTRAYDFGFSKVAEEAFQHWPREELLEDVVRVVREFRPDILVAVFTGTPADGHGQHQASGIMAREAFDAAADPTRFPEAGPAHAPVALYRSRFRGVEDATLVLETGALDPLLGKSHHQVAMASRSEHRSQDMGQAQEPGPRRVGIDLVEARFEGAPTGLFSGVDTTLSMKAERAAGADPRLADALARLRSYGAALGAASDPEGGARGLDAASRALDAALDATRRAATGRDGATAADDLLRAILRERRQLHTALALNAGILVDVRAEDATVVPGEVFGVTVSVWNGGDHRVAVERTALDLPAGWTAEEGPEEEVAAGDDAGRAPGGGEPGEEPGGGPPAAPGRVLLEPGAVFERRFRVVAAPDASPTIPYFLRSDRDGDRYLWGADPHAGEAFAPDPVRGVATMGIAPEDAGPPTEVTVSRAAAFVDVDKTVGEYRLPVLVVPALGVSLDPRVALVPAADPGAVDYVVRVTSYETASVSGAASLDLPPGWSSDPAAVDLEVGPGGTASAAFRVAAPATMRPDTYQVVARFTSAERVVETGIEVVDYPHIRPRLLPTRASSVLQVLDVAVPEGLAVGYVEGAGDDGAEALRQLGVDVTMLDAAALATGDLDRFDTIVLGIRAYEFRPDVVAHNARLLDYARRGGTLIVQYNKYEFPQGDFAPYPLTMSRPHDRVTDEAAEVRVLVPDHALFTWPNAIGPEDFAGWVQERGLYFAATWDDRYEPLLEMADPGEAPLRGSTLIAPLGDGTYVYTGLSLFRQLPAGVPGAYRLLANLIALGADGEAS
ncbi:MAG TPA: PIG-L family deacetylase [Longimicrobiales bacterium]|nr:PIG-L family deacetylase [Longimicrobiales bacterium]